MSVKQEDFDVTGNGVVSKVLKEKEGLLNAYPEFMEKRRVVVDKNTATTPGLSMIALTQRKSPPLPLLWIQSGIVYGSILVVYFGRPEESPKKRESSASGDPSTFGHWQELCETVKEDRGLRRTVQRLEPMIAVKIRHLDTPTMEVKVKAAIIR
ncbi:hypothetical protein J6590_067562 [Homalodisca vitripennis]|nr:hypothetical protein J6590_067562 [Homalodisca vitripennis]